MALKIMLDASERPTLRGLDWLNFVLADVQGGVGPFLAIYLWSSQGWDATHVGLIMTIAGIATVAARAPAGALVDWTVWKRALIVVVAAIVALGAIVLSLFPLFWPAAAAQTLIRACDAAFPPAIAAISLGIVGRQAFTGRVGRNEAFNHAGNVFTAIIASLVGYLIAPAAVLWLVALLAAMSAFAALSIDGGEIDHSLARGLDNNDDGGEHRKRPSGLRVMFECKPLLVFTAAITLFHFANAAMLPLVGERLSQGHKDSGSLFNCIIAAQAIMIPMAMLVGAKSDTWGRKPLFRRPPHPRSAVHGVGCAAWGTGAALSNSVAGLIVDKAGFNAGVAALAFLLFWLAVPETGKRSWLAEDAVDGQVSRDAKPRPPSAGRIALALMATLTVATGTLVFGAAVVLVIKLAPLAVSATHSIDVGFLTRHISWGNGTTIAAIGIFVATYLVVAIGKLPGYQLDRAGAALTALALWSGWALSRSIRLIARSISTLSRYC